MCGIFGYVGSERAGPILLGGLRTLEYRGYDSAGLYVPGYGVVKAVGPIETLAAKIGDDIIGTSGIAHTRWATHGAPTEVNAHPHGSADGTLWLVHNGIIENYREIRAQLSLQGIACASDTDSEVLAALIAARYDGADLVQAVKDALREVRGTYGIAVMHTASPHSIIAARSGSPIVIGVGTDGHFVSSDPSALLAHTKDVVYLEDGELAVITQHAYDVRTVEGELRTKTPEPIAWDLEAIQKQGFQHFMLKEIHEAPDVIENTIRGRLIEETGTAKLGGLENMQDTLAALDRLAIAACGSAYLAGYAGKYLLEEYARLPVDLELASEYRYKTNVPYGRTALLAVTQSGETADTLAAVRRARSLNLPTLGMVNVVGSSIARETDAGVYNHAGPEIAVASTKAFISQLTVFAILALFFGRNRGMNEREGKEIVGALTALPDMVRRMLADTSQVEMAAKKYAHYQNAMFIGRNTSTPIAFEGALKLKEVTYIHAEAYAGGELKHGSIALLDEQFPVVALAPHDSVYEKMLSNIEEVKARGAPVLAIATEGDENIASLADDVLYIPKTHPIVQPIVAAIPLHLFAYFVGVEKGQNVDRPRNLAKSVTVE